MTVELPGDWKHFLSHGRWRMERKRIGKRPRRLPAPERRVVQDGKKKSTFESGLLKLSQPPDHRLRKPWLPVRHWSSACHVELIDDWESPFQDVDWMTLVAVRDVQIAGSLNGSKDDLPGKEREVPWIGMSVRRHVPFYAWKLFSWRRRYNTARQTSMPPSLPPSSCLSFANFPLALSLCPPHPAFLHLCIFFVLHTGQKRKKSFGPFFFSRHRAFRMHACLCRVERSSPAMYADARPPAGRSGVKRRSRSVRDDWLGMINHAIILIPGVIWPSVAHYYCWDLISFSFFFDENFVPMRLKSANTMVNFRWPRLLAW